MSCYAHPAIPQPSCPDCHALSTSLATRQLYADIEDARIRAQMEPLKEEWAGRDMARDGGPLSLAEMVQDIERWVVGERDVSHPIPVIEDGRVVGYAEGQDCVPEDDKPHAIINGHHVSWCPCDSRDRDHEPGPWDAWGSEDPWK